VVHALKYHDAVGRIVTAPIHAITLPQGKTKGQLKHSDIATT
jgi:hypothetical protein